MRNPALSRIVRGLSSRTSTAAIIAGFVLVAPISHAVSAGFAGTGVAASGAFDLVNSSLIAFNSSVSDHGVINWTPTDNATNAGAPINFLPTGETVTFTGGGSPYTVLNRILTSDLSRPVSLNGTINSYIGSSSGPAGGSIWFYSPAGILVGGGAVFNVGSLLLTTADPGSTGSFLTTDSSGTHFSLAAANNGSKVTIASGAQINASVQSGSYVALIAPSVQQSGTVTVNGSAAYVAARAADMTINQGLFDISVTLPTEETGPQLIHDGSTGMSFASGTAPGATDTHRIYLVSVPKNDAITLLIQGGSNLGFDIAGSATVSGSTIVLSAGRNITDANTSGAAPFAIAAATGANANIAINTGTFRSAVTGSATHNAIVSNGGNAVNITFASDLTLTAPNFVSVGSATAGQSVTIGGNLLLDASVIATTDGGAVTAGTAQLFATAGGGITVGGTATILANATGNGSPINANAPVSATGGIAQITSFGGAIDIAAATDLEANAVSGIGPVTSAPLTLTGGQVNLQASGSGASLHFHNTLDASATDSTVSMFNPSGYDASGSTAAGTSGHGGTVTLQNSGGGTLTADGFATINADGLGQPVLYGPVGGAGTGGVITITAAGGGITLADGVEAFARGFGGDVGNATSNGGLGTGGQITIGTSNATGSLVIGQVSSEASFDVDANGQGGANGLTGGNGMGGQIHLANNGGTTHSFIFTSLYAEGSGGTGVVSGNGTGGLAEITSSGGTTTLDVPIDLRADAGSGGVNNDGIHTPQSGNALGGTGQIIASGTGQIIINANLEARVGGTVPVGDVNYIAGGNGTGGTFNLYGLGTGVVHFVGASLFVDVNANGGDTEVLTGAPGTGTGGKMFVDAQIGSSITIDDLLSGNATGAGGSGFGIGTGAAGTGGMLTVGSGSGLLTVGSVQLVADGYGGHGLTAGGAGTGGNAAVQVLTLGGSIHVASSVDLSAQGFGGNGETVSPPMGVATTGGAGTGGMATVDAENGSIAIGTASTPNSYIKIDTSGTGGQGVNGGAGTGGGGNVNSNGGSSIYTRVGSVTFTPSTSYSENFAPVSIFSNGQGGVGATAADGSAGQGGAGTGGFTGLQAVNSTLATEQSVITLPTTANLVATGTGGDGGQGGSSNVGGIGGVGTGGETLLNAQAGNGKIVISALTADAGGLGGAGGGGATGGAGGAGIGGYDQTGVFSNLLTSYTQGVAQLGDVTVNAGGVGGDGGTGTTIGGAGGIGQGGLVGLVSRGGTVSATSALLSAAGQGGDGGSGQSATGAGGEGDGGVVGFLSTYRYQTSVIGTMNVSGQVTGIASGVSGNGGTLGQTVAGNFQIEARGSALSAGSIVFAANGATVPANAVASEIAAVATGTITVANTLSASTGGDIGLYFDQGGTLNVPSSVISARSITPFGDLDLTAPTGTGIFNATSMTFFVQQDFRTTASFNTPGAFTLAVPGAIQTGAITADQSIHLQSDGDASYGALVAGDKIQIVASGSVTVASASAGRVNPSSDANADYQIGIQAGTSAFVGDVTAKGSIGIFAATGDVTTGSVTTDQSFVVLSANNITTGAITTLAQGAGAGVYLANASMYPLVQNNLDPTVLFARAPVAAGGSILIGGPVSTSRFAAAAASRFTSSSITASDLLNIDFNSTAGAIHGVGLATGDLTSGKQVLVQSDGDISTGSVTAGDSIIVASTGGKATLGNLSAGLVNPTAASGQGYSAQVFASNGSAIGSIAAKGEVRLQTLNGSVTTGDVVTGRDLIVLAKQDVILGAVTTSLVPTSSGPPTNPSIAPGGIYIGHSDGTAPASSTVFATLPTRIEGSIAFNGAVNTGTFIAATAGAFIAPSINSNDFVTIDAGGATSIGSLVSRYDTEITGDSSATIGTIDTGGEGHVEVAGQIIVGGATAGRMAFAGSTATNGSSTVAADAVSHASDSGSSVILIGNAGVTLGAASAAGDVGLVSGNNIIVTGALVADASVGALVSGNLTLGSVTTGGGANGVYIGSSSLYPSVRDADGNAAELLFAKLPPPPTGGSVLITGPVSTGRFAAASGGAFTVNGTLAASDVSITSGDLATFNGAVTAPTIAITSGDLAIGSSGSLGNLSTASLQLTSTTAQTTIGSATTGASAGQTGLATSYTLDNAEFARLQAAQIGVTASGDITLAGLNISGSASKSGNLVGSNARFQVQTPGSIRVVGSVNLANAASTDTLSFIAGNRFEIATDTGQLQLLGTDGKVGGIAAITAANIAVGPSSLLSQLAADPKFAGRDLLLGSAPLTGGKLDGYLQARQLKFTVGNTLLIQNSGIGTTLAGFSVGAGGVQIANSGTNPIDVVIYGRAYDSTGTEILAASIGSVVTASQTSTTSNVDGCVFATGTCSTVDAGATTQLVAQTQLASISSSVQSAITGAVGIVAPTIDNGTSTVGGSGGGSSSNSSSSSDDDEGGGKSESKGNAAAAKPNMLIDTNAIGSSLTPQVDTPVTSSGNTSLWIGEDGLTGDIGSSGTGNNQ